MRRLLLLTITLISLVVRGSNVTEQQALQKAQRFMPDKQFVTSSIRRSGKISQQAGDTPFYVFNVKQHGGFVIVSGDDRTEAILGYSKQGTFDLDNMPDNLRWWLEEYARQLKAIETHQAMPTPRRAQTSTMSAIEPLIKTQWRQSNPYNLMTPISKNSNGEEKHCVTGCVATAFAQVMNYWQWPKECPAIPSYTTSSLNLQLDELPATTFKWDLIQRDYDYSNEVNDNTHAVAELMRYVGQALHMDYTVTESGIAVQPLILMETFNYSRNLRKIFHENFTTAEWEDIIYQDLAAGRPVIYEGYPCDIQKLGHAFICDGYDGDGLFHFNWGWGGDFDGYFVLSLANYLEEGVGKADGTGYYGIAQSAIIGIEPSSGNEPERLFIKPSYPSFSERTYSRTSSDKDFMNVWTGSWNLSVYYNCVPTTTYPIEAGWAISKSDEILKILTTDNIIIDNRDTSPFTIKYYEIPVRVNFGAGLSDGNYRLVQVWRPQGTTDWIIASSPTEAEIVGNNLSVRCVFSSNYTIDDVTFSGEMAEGTENRATVTLSNTGTNKCQQFLFEMKIDNKRKTIWKGETHVEPNQTGQLNFKFTLDVPGEYEVKITSLTSDDTQLWQSKITIHEFKKKTVDGIQYYLNPGTNEVKVIGTSPGNNLKDLEIPATISFEGYDYPVTRIANNAFKGNNIYKVVIHEGINIIGAEAFRACTFLKEVRLPSTLKEVGKNAFSYCYRLKTVVCTMQNPCSISPNVFEVRSETENSKVFTSAELFVPKGTKEVYQRTEGWMQFQTIFEGEVKDKSIDNVMYRCVTGENFADIVDADVSALKNKDLIIPSSVIVDGKAYKIRKIENNVFGYVEITSLTIEPGLEEIGEKNFYTFPRVKEVVIPEGVKIIGNESFYSSYGLEKLSLPSTLEYLGEKTFYSCNRIKSIISAMQKPCPISNEMWNNVFSSATLYVPIGSKESYLKAEGWNQFTVIYEGDLREKPIDDITYRYITGEDFADIVKADKNTLNDKDLVIPCIVSIDDKYYKLRKIEKSVFAGAKIKSLTIEQGLEEIGENAFSSCTNLEKVTIPEGVKVIGSNAFYDCSGIKVVISGMKQPCPITPDVFQKREVYDGETLKVFTTATLYVPEGSKEAYQQAEGWNQFQSIFEGEVKEFAIGDLTYRYATGEDFVDIVKADLDALNGKDLIIPANIVKNGKTLRVRKIADNAFRQGKMKSLTIEQGLEEIGQSAFYQCILKEIVIPEGVQSVNGWAFQGCYKLKTVSLPSTLKNLGPAVFYNCDELKNVFCAIQQPFPINPNVFQKFIRVDNEWVHVFTTATLYVPEGTEEVYRQTEGWNQFKIITANETGISKPLLDSQRHLRIYTSSGKRTECLQKGLNIVVMDDGTAKKVLVR